MTKLIWKTCFVIIFGVALLLVPKIAFACSCDLPPFGKTEKQLIKIERKKSQAIFTGEVTDIIIPKNAAGEDSWIAEVRFKVLQTWKGVTTETASVFTAHVCCICGYKFTVGEHYLVYTYGSPTAKLSTNFCTRTKPLWEASKDLKVLGKTNVSKR